MKKVQLAVAVALSVVVLGAFSTTVQAQTDEINQEQRQDLEIHCDVGSYGQNVNCWARGQQEQKFSAKLQEQDGKTVIVRRGRVVPIHYVVDTGLDMNTMMLAAGAIAAGAGAAAVKFKTK